MPVVNIKGLNTQANFPDDMSMDDMLRILQQQDFLGLNDGIGLPQRSQSVEPVDKSLAQRAGQGISDFLSETGIISNPSRAHETGQTFSALAEILPGIGDATAGDEFGKALAEGDKFGMAMGMLGGLPVVGDVAKKLKGKFPDFKMAISETADNITLSKIIVPDELRGSGKGTEFMVELIGEADKKGKPIGLTPSSDFGGNKKRLTKFYERFGFVPNKGKNKDFTISESMIRPAKEIPIGKPTLPMDEASRMAPVKGEIFKADSKSSTQYLIGDDGSTHVYLKARGEWKDVTGKLPEKNIKKKHRDISEAGGLDNYESQAKDRLAARDKERIDYRAEKVKQEESYKMQHTAPMRSDNPSGSNVENAFPGMYSGHSNDYLTGMGYDNKAINIIKSMKGNPNKSLTVYRSVPNNVKEINKGDWIATTREYAKDHMEGEKGWHILSKKVKAKDIATDGNSIHEWGYDPD